MNNKNSFVIPTVLICTCIVLVFVWLLHLQHVKEIKLLANNAQKNVAEPRTVVAGFLAHKAVEAEEVA